MMLFLWYIVWITSVISSSDDSISSSNDDNDNSEYKGKLDGEYRDASGQSFNSVCTADNGNIYAASGPLTGDAVTEFVNVIGRSTSGVTKLSDGIFQATFDVFQFNPSESGVLRVTATFTKNTNTGVATLSFPGAGAINITSISNKGTHCLIPDGNWNDANEETPFMTASDTLPKEMCQLMSITKCVTISRFEDTTACFGVYDTDANQFVAGGNMAENVQIMWDGELRIADFTMSLDACASGTAFVVWTKEEEQVTISWKCAGSFGTMYPLSTEADVLEEVENEKCPLFSGISGAKQMSGQNILGDNRNENGNSNVVNQEIVIKFSNATIGNLWAILIVFILVTVIMCWFVNSKKKRGN
eukprot:274823_1